MVVEFYVVIAWLNIDVVVYHQMRLRSPAL